MWRIWHGSRDLSIQPGSRSSSPAFRLGLLNLLAAAQLPYSRAAVLFAWTRYRSSFDSRYEIAPTRSRSSTTMKENISTPPSRKRRLARQELDDANGPQWETQASMSPGSVGGTHARRSKKGYQPGLARPRGPPQFALGRSRHRKRRLPVGRRGDANLFCDHRSWGTPAGHRTHWWAHPDVRGRTSAPGLLNLCN